MAEGVSANQNLKNREAAKAKMHQVLHVSQDILYIIPPIALDNISR